MNISNSLTILSTGLLGNSGIRCVYNPTYLTLLSHAVMNQQNLSIS